MNLRMSPTTIGISDFMLKVNVLMAPFVVFVRVSEKSLILPAIAVATFFLYPTSIALTPSVSKVEITKL